MILGADTDIALSEPIALGERPLTDRQQSGLFSDMPGLWHLLHTKSRQEKALAESLAAMAVPCFLPLLRVKRNYGGRKAVADLPMFPGYVFLRGSLDQAYLADRTKRVAQVIRVVDQTRITWELRNIELALLKEAFLDPFPRLVRGTRVEVKTGPFRGLQGVIEDRSKRDRLILQVDVLGKAASLEIDGAQVEPLD